MVGTEDEVNDFALGTGEAQGRYKKKKKTQLMMACFGLARLTRAPDRYQNFCIKNCSP